MYIVHEEFTVPGGHIVLVGYIVLAKVYSTGRG